LNSEVVKSFKYTKKRIEDKGSVYFEIAFTCKHCAWQFPFTVNDEIELHVKFNQMEGLLSLHLMQCERYDRYQKIAML